MAFFVHDLGYWGKPNMDGAEGETHPEAGAKIMRWLFDGKRTGKEATWSQLTLYHSRFYSMKHDVLPSRLCVADKLATALTPAWLYVILTSLTGEIQEYMKGQRGRDEFSRGHDKMEFAIGLKKFCRDWAYEERDLQ